MSDEKSPTDRCAYCGRVRINLWHQVRTSDEGTHAFAEPAVAEDLPAAPTIPVDCCPHRQASVEAPDDAKARAASAWIDDSALDAPAREILTRHGLPSPSLPVAWNDHVIAAVREAFAAGKEAAKCFTSGDINSAYWKGVAEGERRAGGACLHRMACEACAANARGRK